MLIKIIRIVFFKLRIFENNRIITYTILPFILCVMIYGLFFDTNQYNFELILEYSFYILISSISVESASSIIESLKKGK